MREPIANPETHGKPVAAESSLAVCRRRAHVQLAVIWTLTAFLASWLGLFVWATRNWPLVRDASIIQYAAFLIGHGFAPYRQIVEMNFPGCYLVQWMVIHTLGGGAGAWRSFDFLLLAATGGAMVIIARPYGQRYGWFGGFVAAAVFALIHGQDGVALSGERDLIVTALFAWAYAFLFLAIRRRAGRPEKTGSWLMFLALLACGVAATMKPVAVPAGPILIVLVIFRLRQRKLALRRSLVAACVGFLLPIAAVGAYLAEVHAVGAFFTTMFGLARYYSGLYHKSFWFLLSHSAAPVGPLAVLWIILALARRDWNWEKLMLAGGAIYGFAYYIAQARGFPYYRYPMLSFLLLSAAIEFETILFDLKPRKPLIMRGMAVAAAIGSIYALFFVAPRSAVKAAGYDGQNQQFLKMLSTDLETIGGNNLSGEAQCFDTTAGCINTLYRMRVVQATGFFYDCYAYAPRGQKMMAVVDDYRSRFRSALERSSPRILVVTNQYCQQGPDTYAKLDRWPWLARWVGKNYRLYVQRMPPDKVYWWSRAEKPFGYRIYLRR